MARINPNFPIGTPAEVLAAGMDPAEIATCSPPDERSRNPGCPWFADCQFNLRKHGGFKGDGPRNVGYFLRLRRADLSKQKEGIASCYQFVATLQGRMLDGIDARNRGKDHETIEVIAQEGEEILVREWGYKDAAGAQSGRDIRETYQDVKLTVPRFPRPGENAQQTHDEKLNARAAEREAKRLLTEEGRVGRPDAAVTVPDTTDDGAGKGPAIGTGPARELAAPARRQKAE